MATNQNNQIKINTSGISFFDTASTLLKADWFDNRLTVSYCFPTKNGEGKNSYPKDDRKSLILSQEVVCALYKVAIERLLPAMEAGRAYKGGSFLYPRKKDSLIQFEYDPEVSDSVNVNAYFEIDDNRIAHKTYMFTFDPIDFIEDYVPTDGNFRQEKAHIALTLFIKLLETYLDTFTKAGAHFDRVANAYTSSYRGKILNDMAAKLGVQTYSGNNSGGYSGSSNNSFDGGLDDDLPFGDIQPKEVSADALFS